MMACGASIYRVHDKESGYGLNYTSKKTCCTPNIGLGTKGDSFVD